MSGRSEPTATREERGRKLRTVVGGETFVNEIPRSGPVVIVVAAAGGPLF